MSDLGRLYPEVILAHHRAPRHATALSEPTHAASGNNPLCGDRVNLTLRVVDGRLLEVGCEVKGCAICRAAGSMMAEAIVGRERVEVAGTSERFLLALAAEPRAPQPATGAPGSGGEAPAAPAGVGGASLDGPAPSDEAWGPLAALLEARRYPNRRRCASLCWEVLSRALGA